MAQGSPSPVASTTGYAHPRLHQLIGRAQAAARQAAAPQVVALVHPCDAHALRAAAAMVEAGIARPLLVGAPELIARAAAAAEVDARRFEVMATSAEPKDAAARAVALARDGSAAALMKGSLHSDEYLGAIVSRSGGLLVRDTRVSHAFLFDLPRYHKLLALADCVVNVAPKPRAKHHILANAVQLLHTLGVAEPKVAVVTAVETVTEAIQATVDARLLVEASLDGEFGPAIVEGPFGFDNAFSAEAARIKGLKSHVAGDADLMVMPDLNAGNMLYKSFVYVGGAECAGLVLGVKVPVILTSRADSQLARLASVALAVLAGGGGG
ncbi:MAG: bifunctional enoyl-CoA hydratase/phosphate acetyltransferase [Rubrivivax sp.]|nr:bifunctional enoyl-CoA hydratase/phosphate acetyltransferase [Rubrivivax sp.]